MPRPRILFDLKHPLHHTSDLVLPLFLGGGLLPSEAAIEFLILYSLLSRASTKTLPFSSHPVMSFFPGQGQQHGYPPPQQYPSQGYGPPPPPGYGPPPQGYGPPPQGYPPPNGYPYAIPIPHFSEIDSPQDRPQGYSGYPPPQPGPSPQPGFGGYGPPPPQQPPRPYGGGYQQVHGTLV